MSEKSETSRETCCNEQSSSVKEILRTLETINRKLHAIEGNTKVCDEEETCVSRSSRRAILVWIRVNISSVSDIDTVKQEFSCEFFLAATWEEPQLNGQYNIAEIDWSQQWDPRIYFVNAVEIKSMQKKHKVIRLPCKPHPTVQLSFRVVGRFKSQFMLQNFPFDIQTLKIQVSSKWSSAVLIFDRTPNIPCVLSNANFLGKDEWNLLDHVIARGGDLSEDSNKVSLISYSTFSFEFHIRRRYVFYLTNIVFMMFLISLLSFTTFSIQPDEPGDRLSVILTLLLTAVTFKFVVSQSLPPVSYLTVLDWYILTSVIFIFAVALENSIVSKVDAKENKKIFDNISCGVACLAFIVIHLWYGIKAAIIIRRATKELEYHQRCYKWKNGLLPVCEELVSGTLRNMSHSFSPSPRRPLRKEPSADSLREVSPSDSAFSSSQENMTKDECTEDKCPEIKWTEGITSLVGSVTRRKALGESQPPNKEEDSEINDATRQDERGEFQLDRIGAKGALERWNRLRSSFSAANNSYTVNEKADLATASHTAEGQNATSMETDCEATVSAAPPLTAQRSYDNLSSFSRNGSKSKSDISFGYNGDESKNVPKESLAMNLYPHLGKKLKSCSTPNLRLSQRTIATEDIADDHKDDKMLPKDEAKHRYNPRVSGSLPSLEDGSANRRSGLLKTSRTIGSLLPSKYSLKSVSFDLKQQEGSVDKGIVDETDMVKSGKESELAVSRLPKGTLQGKLPDLETAQPIPVWKEIQTSSQDAPENKTDYEESSGSDLSDSEITGPIAKTESDISVIMLGGMLRSSPGPLSSLRMGGEKRRGLALKRG